MISGKDVEFQYTILVVEIVARCRFVYGWLTVQKRWNSTSQSALDMKITVSITRKL